MKRQPAGAHSDADGRRPRVVRVGGDLSASGRPTSARQSLAPAVGTDGTGTPLQVVDVADATQSSPTSWRSATPRSTRPTAEGLGGVKASAEARLEAAYAVVDEALGRGGPYLLGEALSVADFYLLMLSRLGWGAEEPPANRTCAIRRCDRSGCGAARGAASRWRRRRSRVNEPVGPCLDLDGFAARRL